MPNIMEMLQGGGQQPMQPQPGQPAMQQPQSPGGAGLLGKIAPQLQTDPNFNPQPTQAQTVAAIHRFSSIKQAMQTVMQDPNFGKSNVRPKLLDVSSKLLASKVLSLPEIMNAIKGLPDDPLQQKAFVEKIFSTADQAQKAVLSHHAKAQLPEPQEGDQWSPETHDQHIGGLMRHYNG